MSKENKRLAAGTTLQRASQQATAGSDKINAHLVCAPPRLLRAWRLRTCCLPHLLPSLLPPPHRSSCLPCGEMPSLVGGLLNGKDET